MLAKKKFKKYITKGIRKIRHRKGFGVHSPFAFSLITQVIDEKTPFYAYSRIRQLRRLYVSNRMLVPGRSRRRGYREKELFLLYRLVNRFRSQEILELNNNGGMATFAMSLPNSNSHVLSQGTEPRYLQQANRIIAGEGCRNIELYDLPFEPFCQRLPAGYKADFILIHKSASLNASRLYPLLHAYLHERTIVVIEGIHAEGEMRALWNLFKSSPDVRVSMDLYDIGLAICHNKLYKQHYIVSF